MVTEALTPVGIDGRELGVLVVVDGGDPTSQQDLADQMGIDRTTMVALLDALEMKRLITRRPHQTDRRRNVVVLTTTGSNALDRAIALRNSAEERYLLPLSQPSARQLRRALLRLRKTHAAPTARPH